MLELIVSSEKNINLIKYILYREGGELPLEIS